MKQRSVKRLLSLSLATVLIVGMVGCGQEESSTEKSTVEQNTVESSVVKESTAEQPESSSADESATGIPRISEEVITITVEAPTGAAAMDWDQALNWQVYEEEMGINFDLIGSHTNEQWKSRKTLMFASDEMPDLLALGNSSMGRDEVQMYASEGYLLDWTPYLQYMPNLTALMEKYPEYKSTVTFEDGGIYGFTQLNVSNVEPCNVPLYVFVNKQWCENLGIKYPETVEELYDTLVAFKEQDANGNGDPNDELPMVSVKGNVEVLYPIQWAYGITDRVRVYHLYVDENGKVGIYDTQENNKEFLRYVNRLYKENLINQDMFVIEKAEVNEYVDANRVGYFGNTGYNITADHLKGCISPVGFTSEYNEEAVLCAKNIVGGKFYYLANADIEEEKAIAIAKWIDYIYTDEGQLTLSNGFEGVTYDAKELVPGYFIPDHTRLQEEYGYGTDQQKFLKEKALAYGMGPAYVSSYGTIYGALPHVEDLLADDIFEQCTINSLREMTIREFEDVKIVNAYPNVFYTAEESAERLTLFNDIDTYLKTAYAQFITGEMDVDDDWEEYLKELNKMGLERLLEIEQAAYDRLYQ